MQTDAVRLALRNLMAFCPERWPLEDFWTAAGTDQDLGRSQTISTAYRAILLQLDKAGLQPPAYSPREAPAVD